MRKNGHHAHHMSVDVVYLHTLVAELGDAGHRAGSRVDSLMDEIASRLRPWERRWMQSEYYVSTVGSAGEKSGAQTVWHRERHEDQEYEQHRDSIRSSRIALTSRDEYRNECRVKNRLECGFELKCIFGSLRVWIRVDSRMGSSMCSSVSTCRTKTLCHDSGKSVEY